MIILDGNAMGDRKALHAHLKQRLELLQAHRDDVIARMDEMQRYLDKVNWKIDFYNEKLREYENRNEAQE